MTWDAEQWTRRFELGATNAASYVRENRGRIARNDPRSLAAQRSVDEYAAKADLCDALLGWTETSDSLRHRIEQLSKERVQYPMNIYERSRYESAWRRECELLLKELGVIEAPPG
ncbi:MAG: hypothetical protein ACTHU0_24190 [Kofleriaceae bacterium]